MHATNTLNAFEQKQRNGLSTGPIEFSFLNTSLYSDPLCDSLNELFNILKLDIPSLLGIQMSNPLLDVHEEIGEYSQYNETFALKDRENWQGELNFSLRHALTTAEQLLLSELTHRYLDKVNSGLKEYVSQFEDLTARSLLQPDPCIIENLCFREGRLCMRFGQSLSVLFVSCDQFNEIQLKHGEYNAAILLEEFCQQLTGGIRDYDFLLRHGENEFCILLNQVEIEKANQIATRINSSFNDKHLLLNGFQIPISASIGIAEINPQETVEHTLKVARHALQLAEKRGGDQSVYSDGCFLY